MGGFFSSPAPPPPPPPPAAPPPPPKVTDAGQIQARRSQRRKAVASTGLQGTKVTGGQGLLTDAQTTEPTLLG